MPEFRYIVTEFDPSRAVGRRRPDRHLTATLDEGDEPFPAWAAHEWPPERFRVELELERLRPWRLG